MAMYKVGDYIHDIRKKRGITQEELAFGICSTGTLSRIENNSQFPSVRTYYALMERLGEAPHLFSVFTNMDEITGYKMNRKILRLLSEPHICHMEELLHDYAEHVGEGNPIALQFLLSARALYRARKREDPKQICQELQQALQITMEEEMCSCAFKKKRLLTYDEILIWNNMAIQYKRMGEDTRAMRMLLILQEYMDEKIDDEEEKAGLYPVIVYNLAKWMNEAKQYGEALENCEKGIRLCLKYGKLVPLPYLHYQKAVGFRKLGQYAEAGKYMKQAENLLEILKYEKEIFAEEMIAAV